VPTDQPRRPRPRPRFNRQLNISVTEELLRQLRADAVEYGISLAEVVRFYIEAARRATQASEAAQSRDEDAAPRKRKKSAKA
jgi:hypothetical protein